MSVYCALLVLFAGIPEHSAHPCKVHELQLCTVDLELSL